VTCFGRVFAAGILILCWTAVAAQERVQFPSLGDNGSSRAPTLLDGYLFRPAGVTPGFRSQSSMNKRALDAAEFLKRQIELVLPAVGRKLLDHGGGCDGAGFQRRDRAPHLAPVFAD
jgi:hypothetical protein